METENKTLKGSNITVRGKGGTTGTPGKRISENHPSQIEMLPLRRQIRLFDCQAADRFVL